MTRGFGVGVRPDNVDDFIDLATGKTSAVRYATVAVSHSPLWRFAV